LIAFDTDHLALLANGQAVFTHRQGSPNRPIEFHFCLMAWPFAFCYDDASFPNQANIFPCG
jgi:hypothetical protein